MATKLPPPPASQRQRSKPGSTLNQRTASTSASDVVSLPRQGPSAATATAMVLHPEPIRALPPQLPPQPVVTSPLSVRIRPAVLGPPPRTTTHRRFPNSFSSSRSAQPSPSSSSSPASLSPPPSNQHRDTKTPPPPALIAYDARPLNSLKRSVSQDDIVAQLFNNQTPPPSQKNSVRLSPLDELLGITSSIV